MAAQTPENSLFKSIFGRFFGICGDDLGHKHLYLGGPNGKVVASTRNDIDTIFTGLNGAGPVTLASANVGDIVISVLNVTTPADESANFESVISVAGQIQQTSASNLSGNKYNVWIKRQS